MDPKNWEKIKWIQTPEEIQEGVRKQLADRMIKMLRKVTIQGIKSKIMLSEIRNLCDQSSK
jgi:hypothetical protein